MQTPSPLGNWTQTLLVVSSRDGEADNACMITSYGDSFYQFHWSKNVKNFQQHTPQRCQERNQEVGLEPRTHPQDGLLLHLFLFLTVSFIQTAADLSDLITITDARPWNQCDTFTYFELWRKKKHTMEICVAFVFVLRTLTLSSSSLSHILSPCSSFGFLSSSLRPSSKGQIRV